MRYLNTVEFALAKTKGLVRGNNVTGNMSLRIVQLLTKHAKTMKGRDYILSSAESRYCKTDLNRKFFCVQKKNLRVSTEFLT